MLTFSRIGIGEQAYHLFIMVASKRVSSIWVEQHGSDTIQRVSMQI